MKFNKLGQTTLVVSELGLGTWALSGAGYGPTDDDESLATIHLALEGGINFIDTADSYGMGHSEELIGRVLSERGDKDTIIATKFGWDFYRRDGIKGNLEKDYIKYALDRSLKRLKRDSIDIYQIHSQRFENIVKFKVIETLEELKDDGIIRYFGISVSFTDDTASIMENGKIDTLQLKYNLLSPQAGKVLDKSANKVGIICRESLANGFLSGKYSNNSRFPKTDHRNGLKNYEKKDIIERVEKFRFLEKKKRTLTQASIDFCLQNQAVDITLIGPKNRRQLNEIIDSDYEKLSQQELDKIDLIHADWI